jgi:hypothetical protein
MMLLAAALLASCAAQRDRDNIRQGLLTLDLPQTAFLDVWGRPTQTAATSGDEIIKEGVAGWGSFFFKRREMYEKWDYSPRNVELIFYNQRLVAWKTSETVQQLATPQPQGNPQPLFPKY